VRTPARAAVAARVAGVDVPHTLSSLGSTDSKLAQIAVGRAARRARSRAGQARHGAPVRTRVSRRSATCCKPVGSAFAASNPAPSLIRLRVPGEARLGRTRPRFEGGAGDSCSRPHAGADVGSNARIGGRSHAVSHAGGRDSAPQPCPSVEPAARLLPCRHGPGRWRAAAHLSRRRSEPVRSPHARLRHGMIRGQPNRHGRRACRARAAGHGLW
jgi:hypothetical protein